MKAKGTFLTVIACILIVCSGTVKSQSALPADFKIATYINQFDEKGTFPNGKAGWSYWFFDKGVTDTLSIKTSRIFLASASHAPHTHPADEAFYIVRGPVIVHINGQERTLQTGDFYYCPSYSSHNISRTGNDTIQYYIMTRETKGENRAYPVGKADYTIDDCIYFPNNDPAWTNGEKSATVRALDEKFSGGMRIVMHRVIHGDTNDSARKPYTAEQEVFYIISGEADVTLNGQAAHIQPNTAFWCPKGTLRSVVQSGNEPLVFIQCTTHLNSEL
jgi:mannose-6-phosphate isomerase-like protein (cupin superfamily)